MSEVVKVHEIVRLNNATGLIREGQLVAAAVYSPAAESWCITDDRVRPLGQVPDRTLAELCLIIAFLEWPQ